MESQAQMSLNNMSLLQSQKFKSKKQLYAFLTQRYKSLIPIELVNVLLCKFFSPKRTATTCSSC